MSKIILKNSDEIELIRKSAQIVSKTLEYLILVIQNQFY